MQKFQRNFIFTCLFVKRSLVVKRNEIQFSLIVVAGGQNFISFCQIVEGKSIV